MPMSMVTITGIGAMPTSFTVINEYAVMSIPAVWRAVNWLAGTLAGLPKSVSLQNGRVYQTAQHPLNKMLGRKMNSDTTPFVFWQTFFHHAVLWGNAYRTDVDTTWRVTWSDPRGQHVGNITGIVETEWRAELELSVTETK